MLLHVAVQKPHPGILRSDANDRPLVAPEGDHVLPQGTGQVERLLVVGMILVRLNTPVKRATHVLVIRIRWYGFSSNGVLGNEPGHLVRHEEASPMILVVAPIWETIIDDLEMHAV